jgi:hypothetical protein
VPVDPLAHPRPTRPTGPTTRRADPRRLAHRQPVARGVPAHRSHHLNPDQPHRSAIRAWTYRAPTRTEPLPTTSMTDTRSPATPKSTSPPSQQSQQAGSPPLSSSHERSGLGGAQALGSGGLEPAAVALPRCHGRTSTMYPSDTGPKLPERPEMGRAHHRLDLLRRSRKVQRGSPSGSPRPARTSGCTAPVGRTRWPPAPTATPNGGVLSVRRASSLAELVS